MKVSENAGQEETCCLVRVCNVTQGTGVCRSMKNNGCQDGKFFAGTGRPWPCPGPDDISCCVKYVDMNNGTSTTPSSSMPMTSGSQTTSPSTNSATSSSVPSETGLNGGQIGGIAAGCAVFALLIAIGAVYFFRRRKPAAAEEEKPDTSDSTISEMPDSAGVVPRAPQKKIVSELDSEEKKPDKSVVINQARELDSTPIASPVELDASPVEDGGYKV
ncbi:hypothetical protein FQN49_006617 [Arthroderma sp. PD_2]|nr:hypothetical protein FQN49_006617 [Arthroderma sp. PD_2]